MENLYEKGDILGESSTNVNGRVGDNRMVFSQNPMLKKAKAHNTQQVITFSSENAVGLKSPTDSLTQGLTNSSHTTWPPPRVCASHTTKSPSTRPLRKWKRRAQVMGTRLLLALLKISPLPGQKRDRRIVGDEEAHNVRKKLEVDDDPSLMQLANNIDSVVLYLVVAAQQHHLLQ